MQTYNVGYVCIVHVRWVAQGDCVAESVIWTSLFQVEVDVTAIEISGLTLVVGHGGVPVCRSYCTRIGFGVHEQRGSDRQVPKSVPRIAKHRRPTLLGDEC